ncbi:caspase family protein [Cyanobacteria bacterium FACHB-DQ100]|nr:caspase family protein [Cyanobacteria bacterium FACHB-DQ100]
MPRALNRSSVLETGQAKLWILLIGVNRYRDPQLPSLQYSAIDCQGLSEALIDATQSFPQRSMQIRHDFGVPATLSQVRDSLKEIVRSAQAADTILVYFSGHGVLETTTQQPILCLTDTQKADLLNTGLSVAELLEQFSQCQAKQQIVWLDACHSGGMTLRGTLPNPTQQLVRVLGRQASESQGFYALLSCDQAQQSWEFPELGHGVFTYFLMQGLRGAAADATGTIDADGLYKYVYHQTLQYIDKSNQQLRLINQQKRGRGETQLQPEYPLQTPKRVVEGFGQFVIGAKSSTIAPPSRQAIVIDAFPNHSLTLQLSKLLSAGFELAYQSDDWETMRSSIQTKLQTPEATTVLLYLRARVGTTAEGEPCLILGTERVSRSWLRQTLRHSAAAQQIVILDCPNAGDLPDWIEELQREQGQCLIAAAARTDPELLTRSLVETLNAADRHSGYPVAAWITQLQLALAGQTTLSVWLSGTQGVIEVFPSQQANRSSDISVCPYRGLQPFTEHDAEFFYGRSTLIQQLLQAVQQQSCLAVVGASGSGKSSIVQAGLMAQLRQGQHVPGSEHWWLGRMCPGDRPFDALVKCLAEPEEQEQVEGLLYQGVEGLVQWFRTRAEPMVMLVIDQFEELFTLCSEPVRQDFLNIVLETLEHTRDRFKLVLTLRADFVAAGLEMPQLAAILQRSSILIPPCLSDEEYRQVIVRPAEQVGLTVEPGLVEVLLQELDRTPGDLPILEFVLEQLWQHRQQGTLTLEAYQSEIGGLQGALEHKAQSAYNQLDPEEQHCARWIFLSLTQLGEGVEDTRRRVLKSELSVAKYPQALVDRTLQSLSAAKLIVINTEDVPTSRDIELSEIEQSEIEPSVTIEVAHEILIRHWSTLRWWLDENRNRLRVQRPIEQAAIGWKKSNRPPDLLLRGMRLAEAEELYVKYTDELTQDTQVFIEASLEARQSEKIALKRRLRRAQQAIAAIASLAVAAFGLGGLALWNQRNAQIRSIQALSASSEALLNSNQQLEALTAAIKAGQQLKQLDRFVLVEVRTNTIATLQQAISQTQESNRLMGHAQQVNDVQMSSDGQLIVTVSNDNLVKLWSREGQLIKDVVGHSDRVLAVAFSPDQQQLATASADKTIKLWNRDGTLIQTLTGHQNWVTSVRFSSNGRSLISGSRDGTIKLWQLDQMRAVQTFRGHRGWVNSVTFGQNDRQILSGGEDGTVRFWQVGRAAALRSLRVHNDRVTSVMMAPNGRSFLTSGDNVAKLWTLNGKEITTLEGHRDQVNTASYSPDGGTIATGSIDRTIRLWNLEGALLQTLQGHEAAVMHVSFSPAGTQLLSASADKTARIWQMDLPIRLDTGLSAMTTSLDGRITAIAAPDHTILLQNNKDFLSLKGHTAPITQIQISPDNTLLISGSADKTIRLWNLSTGELIRTISGHNDRVTALSFSPDQETFASASADRTIKIWTLQGGIHTILQGHTDEVTSLSYSPDGRLASGSVDNTVRLWDVDRRTSTILGKHNLAVAAIAFSPNGKTLASASWDNTIKLWAVDEARFRQTLIGHNGGVTSLSFNQDGSVLASGSDDTTIKLWNSETGELIKTLVGTNDRVASVAFQSDKLLSTSDRLGLTRWNLNLDSLLSRSCDRVRSYLRSDSTKDNRSLNCNNN